MIGLFGYSPPPPPQPQRNQIGAYHGHWQPYSTFYGNTVIGAGTADTRTQEERAAARAAERARARERLDAIPYEGIRTGEVMAWRAWNVMQLPKGWRLCSVSINHVWEPGIPMQGRPDEVSEAHGLPDFQGVYACKYPQTADVIASCFLPMAAVGEVALWGEIHEHEDGYRAEYAEVRSFVLKAVGGHLHVCDMPPKPSLWAQVWHGEKVRTYKDLMQEIAAQLAADYGVADYRVAEI